MRLDIKVVALGLAESRNKAKNMIEGGYISVDGKKVCKPSFEVGEESSVTAGEGFPDYVSRGALKLEGALESFNIDVRGLYAVDIGSSTGGFTECLLRRGAARVLAIDSGRGQLHPRLASDRRVTVCEGFNARELSTELTGELCDLAVCDVSFISQTLLHAPVAGILKDGGCFISLIKPQFEVGRARVGKNGIVRDSTAVELALGRVLESASSAGFSALGLIASPIKGGDGNVEFFAHFVPGGSSVVASQDIAAVVRQTFQKNERRESI